MEVETIKHPNSMLIKKNPWPLDVNCCVTFKNGKTRSGKFRMMQTKKQVMFIGNDGNWINVKLPTPGACGEGVVSKITTKLDEEWDFFEQ